MQVSVGLKAFAFMTPSLINFPMWIGGNGSSNLINAIITMIISAVATFIATLVIGFDDPVDEEKESIHENINSITSPVEGRMISLHNVNDEMFQKSLGKGVAIIPSQGKVYAPASGTISATFETKHAIGMTTEKGVDILIHIGIDTVKLEGKPFIQHVQKGDYVEQGTLLLEFDMKQIKEAGLDPTTMVIVTNSNDYLEVIPTKQETITRRDKLITVI